MRSSSPGTRAADANVPGPTALGIGEVLWDLMPAGPRLGGAPLNVAAHLRRLGLDAGFLTAVGDDDLGRRALTEMARLGIQTDLVQVAVGAPTGTVAVQLDVGGHPTFEIRTPVAYEDIHFGAAMLASVARLDPAAIVYGTLAQRSGPVREATRAVLAAHPAALRVYDVNLRDGCWTPSLVDELLREATHLKLNDAEVEVLGAALGLPSGDPDAFARAAAARYSLDIVCVTLGSAGAMAWTPGGTLTVPGMQMTVADTVGAGDAFIAGFVGLLLRGHPTADALTMANALGALVASRAGAIPPWTRAELLALVGTTRSLAT